MGAVRSRLRRWHVWLGWLVGVPMIFWTVSGLVMVARPIADVRGTALIRDAAPIASTRGVVAPMIDGRAISAMKLESRAGGPRWVISFADGGGRLADPATGALLPAIGAAEAAREVMTRYTGQAKVVETSRVAANSPPLELRRAMDGWRVRMDDDTHFYVDAGSGEIVARRTSWWRIYDFMWGLHIMDPGGREDTHNPFVILFGLLALLTTILAIILLPLVTRWKRNGVKKPRKA